MSPTAASPSTNALPPGLEEHIYRGKWWQHKGIRALNICLLLCLITSSTNGYDGSMMNGLQSLNKWREAFGDPDPSTRGLLNAAQNIGSIVSLPLAPYMTDGLGRRQGLFWGSVIMLIGVVVQSTSHQIGVFIASRAIIGAGLTFATNAAPILITELAYPTQRAPLTALYNSLWYSGSIVAAWTSFGSVRIQNNWAWRLPTVLQALPSIAQVCLIWFIPESPRWLVAKGRELDAQRVLAKYHTATHDETHPVVQYELSEIKASLALTATQNVGWTQLVKTSGNRKRLRIILALAFFSQWSGNGLVSYYLYDVLKGVGIDDEVTQTLYNGILQLFNFAIAVAAAFLCDKIGRRPLFLISTAGMLVSWTVWTLCEGLYNRDPATNSASGYAILAFIFVYYFFYDIAYSPLIVVYTVEITPFRMRAKTLAAFNLFVSASLVFNQYVNPVALARMGWKYYIVYLGWLAFELVFIFFFLVETKNRTLEETAALFDGDDVVAQMRSAGALGANEMVDHVGGAGVGGLPSPGLDAEKKGGGKDGSYNVQHVEHVDSIAK